jgi:hypothetical protein
MKIVQGDELPWARGLEHRGGTFHFRNLMEGTPGRRDNFQLSMGRSDKDFVSPRHRHNFEQFRFQLEGDLDFARDGTMRAGMVGYFPEGASYGPQSSEGNATTIVLQFGGASGAGYMSSEQLKQGHADLAQRGKFEGGAYHFGDSRRKQDAYEAIWEHVFQREMVYPQPRYPGAILFKTTSFAWWPVAAGVARKLLGTFTERGTQLEIVRVEPNGAATLGAPNAEILTFLLKGSGSCGQEALKQYSAVRVMPGETAVIEGGEGLEAFVMTLPRLSHLKQAAA